MRGLASYVMRGRREALLVAVISAAIPMFFWVGAAAVGLVTLRRGLRDGLVVMMWALLPTLALAWYGEIMPAAALVGMMVVAAVLRITVSWPLALCAAAGLGLLLSAGLNTVGSGYLAEVEKMFAALFASVAEQAKGPAAEQLVAPTVTEIAGMFGLMHAVTLAACLLIARWWQAMLYNPGGLRTEFHALRLDRAQTLGLLAAAVLLYQLGPGFRLWAWTPLVPLLFAGIALVHALMASRRGNGLLGLFYAALLVLGPVKQLVVALAVLDGLLDLRRRLPGKPPQDGPGGA
jgi:hypothetical protein